ncbi:hypothetical protein PR003_g11275 [Phytophthora rubi]|uniref:Uncharacterized protein n=1 Tax=Phytophthora rubi TaxID=129364 RepID=A0A6A3MG95_9STRA|nr:hypothetical protein PR001_g11626 [Phytophthora rubi]KAE9338919.1 hypothetical protein PR003_g11275 [Phytophthora rubi]
MVASVDQIEGAVTANHASLVVDLVSLSIGSLSVESPRADSESESSAGFEMVDAGGLSCSAPSYEPSVINLHSTTSDSEEAQLDRTEESQTQLNVGSKPDVTKAPDVFSNDLPPQTSHGAFRCAVCDCEDSDDDSASLPASKTNSDAEFSEEEISDKILQWPSDVKWIPHVIGQISG